MHTLTRREALRILAAVGAAPLGQPGAAAAAYPDKLSAMALEAPQADLVVVGNIATMAADRPHAGGMAIAGGRLVFVGGAGSARRLLRRGGRLIELEPGQMVLPGLIDSHVHMLDAGLARQRCVLDEAKTREQVLAIIADYARANPDLPWVIGGGWDLIIFGQLGPTASELDAVVPDRPAVFYGQDGHSAWVNSQALAAAGITTCGPVPRGRIECGEAGRPSGTLRESAVDLFDAYTQATTEEWLAGLKDAQNHLHSFGITMIQDANVNPRMLEIYDEAARSGLLTMKVVTAQLANPASQLPIDKQVDELVRLRDRYTFGRLSAGTAKIFVDGVLEARTAALLEPYQGRDDRGILNWDADALAELATRLDRAGFQIHMHAIGDQAVRSALDAVAAARTENGPSDNRHHIAHLQLVAAADLPRFRELGIIANFQPFWLFADEWIRDDAAAVIGLARVRQMYPIHSVALTEARIVAGSDWPVTTPDPFLAIQAGVTRQSPERPFGRAWIPSERVSRELLLTAYTSAGAYVNHREREAGSLEAGKAADFIVIDRDVFTIPPHSIGETRVLNTFVDGVEVYRYQPAPTARNNGLSTPLHRRGVRRAPCTCFTRWGGRVTVEVGRPLG